MLSSVSPYFLEISFLAKSIVRDMGWTTFDEMNADRQTLKQSYQNERQVSHVKKRENALE